MKNIQVHLKIVLTLFVFSTVNFTYAAENIEVVTAEGKVVIGDIQEKSSKPVRNKSIVPNGQALSTGDNARAVIRSGNDGYVILGKNSKIEITQGTKDKPGFFKQISGVVYYAINSIKGKKRPVEVRTATTTIGVRGTRFIVTDIEDVKEIGMRKGLVNVSSNEGDFEFHKQAVKDEFEAFKQEGVAAIAKTQSEFDEYKAKTQQEFVEYKKEFSLEANQMASFDGKRVVSLPLSGETEKNMESLEEYADKWLKKVQD